MDASEDDANLVKRASDARERRKLQNRLAQRNFRRRQAIKEKQQMLQQQQEVEETPIPTHSQAGGHRLDRQSPLLPDAAQGATTPQNDVRTIDKTGGDAPAAEHPPIPPLPSPEDDSQTLRCPPPAPPARPISPVAFPLFCSPGDLWIDRPGDQQRGAGSEPYPSIFSNDMSAIPLQAAAHSAEPFTKHSSIETTTALASPYTRRSPVSKKHRLPLEQGGQYQKTSSRRLSAPTPTQYLSTPPESSIYFSDPASEPPAGGKMTLHICAEQGHANVLRFLLSYGAEIDATDSLGRTALHYAAMQGHVDSVCVLLERGAETELADNFGLYPLHIAAQLGHEEVVRMLVCEGADLNARIGSRTLSQP